MSSDRLIQAVVDRLAGGRQAGAAAMLGVSQASVSRYLRGLVEPSLPVITLAETLLVARGAHRGVVSTKRAKELSC